MGLHRAKVFTFDNVQFTISFLLWIVQLDILLWFHFWVLYSIPFIYVPISLPVPLCLDYYSHIVDINICRVIPPTLFLSIVSYSRAYAFPEKMLEKSSLYF